MHTIIIAIGSYGSLYTVECTPQELIALSSVLMRSRPVRDDYRGGFVVGDETTDTRMTVTIVKPHTVTTPATTEE